MFHGIESAFLYNSLFDPHEILQSGAGVTIPIER